MHINKPIILTLNYFLLFTNLIQAQDVDMDISYERKPDRSVVFRYTKEAPGSFYLIINFDDVRNTRVNRNTFILKENSGTFLTLKPTYSDQNIQFSYSYSYGRGVPNPDVDKDFVYSLPFKEGKSIKILEGSNIRETYLNKEKPDGWKSLIVTSNSADSIFCMRKGVVIKVVDAFEPDTSQQKTYTSKLNEITVEHEDGTMATYKGFMKNKIVVKPGQTVYPRTLLGTSAMLNKDDYRVYFYIVYLIMDEADYSNKKYGYVDPVFLTSKGKTRIKSGNQYEVEVSEALIMEELNWFEKRKYKKDPSKF